MKFYSIKIIGKDSAGDQLGFAFKAQKTCLDEAIITAKKAAKDMFGDTHPIIFDVLEYEKDHTAALKEMTGVIKEKI